MARKPQSRAAGYDDRADADRRTQADEPSDPAVAEARKRTLGLERLMSAFGDYGEGDPRTHALTRKKPISTGDVRVFPRSDGEAEVFSSGDQDKSSVSRFAKLFANIVSGIISSGDAQRGFIDRQPTDEELSLSDDEKWTLIDSIVTAFPGIRVGDFGKALFSSRPRANAPQQPSSDAAPSIGGTPRPLWSDRAQGETPVSFIRANYGVWRDGVWDRDGLTKPALRHADVQLYNALAQWERRHPEERLGLPNQKEEVARWVERMTTGEAKPSSAAERERLRSAQRRRAAIERED